MTYVAYRPNVSLFKIRQYLTRTYCMQAVNESGEANAPQAVDVSMQLTVATTASEATSLYAFLGGNAIPQLNAQLNKTGEVGLHEQSPSLHLSMRCSKSSVTLVGHDHELMQVHMFTSYHHVHLGLAVLP